ncbi:hypothetical protein [Streptomyces sp. NRRL S-1868]|uniref:hypothetical protein n=1 Tax=Streptomyces sp. NRRL S-1868 TaxID=1463892 RepID=UPI00068FDBE3|nr:hypothetical protein [Streptomyces sp. NRRL S-1868]
MADARRQARADRRAAKDHRRQHQAANKPAPGHGRGGAAGKVRKGRLEALRARARRRMEAARDRRRERRDRRDEDKVRRLRRLRRLAGAKWRMHRRITLSHMRYWVRRALVAALVVPVGALSCLTTPLGRRLRADWLMHLGRRLHRRLAAAALRARRRRDARIRDDYADTKDGLDTGAESAVADRVPRAPRHHTSGLGDPMAKRSSSRDPGFHFEETAAEMEEAALKFEPDGMMQVLAACEGVPEALTHVANTFKHLAERSDAEFPLEKEVGESLSDVYDLLTKAATASEEIGKTFRRVHEQDIGRHEDPRVNEQTWDTTNN